MKPFLFTPDIIDAYLDAGHWSRETMLDRYRTYAAEYPDKIACSDGTEAYSWAELEAASNRLASNLIDLGLDRDATALIQIPSTCREIVLRVALKKAGIIGVFTPLQWRRKELAYVWERIDPSLVVISGEHTAKDTHEWLDDASDRCHRADMGNTPLANWIGWHDLFNRPPSDGAVEQLGHRPFRFDEISLITASSGTSGLAKLCEWPEGAQLCQSRVLCERMEIIGDDKIGIFAPTAGAAGLMMWMVSWTVPCTSVFPDDYKAPTLLDLVEDAGITVGTTVPVILVRLAQEPLESWDLQSLRLMRVGTAAADMSAAVSFENRSGCRVVVASGSMEVTGFGHAHVNEPKELRLNGSVGLPLDGCRLRIEDERSTILPAGSAGELKVTAPFASSGYWKDPEATAAAWSEGWYSTGDVGVLDDNGRLTLLGRHKETINRSGHKILPAEIEREIVQLPDVIECSVVAAPDREYGQVPWAFVHMRTGCALDPTVLIDTLRSGGLASYKVPMRFVEVTEFPRVNDSKVDKKALLQMAAPATTADEPG
jgi:2,3-dihydroxybenzoate-AMP ligase